MTYGTLPYMTTRAANHYVVWHIHAVLIKYKIGMLTLIISII